MSSFLVFLVCALFSLFVASFCQDCPKGWFETPSACFKNSEFTSKHNNAVTSCAKLHRHSALPVFRNEADFKDYLKALDHFGFHNMITWIGGSDAKNEGTWLVRDTDGTECPMPWANWGDDQLDGGREDNFLFKKNDDKMFDNESFGKIPVICQIPKFHICQEQDGCLNKLPDALCAGGLVTEPKACDIGAFQQACAKECGCPANCPEGWVGVKQACYKFMGHHAGRAKAIATCTDEDPRAGLPVFRHEADFKDFLTWLENEELDRTITYLGGSDESIEGVWQIKGKDGAECPMPWTNWEPESPNGGTKENFIFKNPSDLWWDNSSFGRVTLVCQIPMFDICCKNKLGDVFCNISGKKECTDPLFRDNCGKLCGGC